jgi:hypothetical protein
MSLLTNGQLAQDGEFKLRVKMAMVGTAKDVSAETPTQFIAYVKRANYATVVMNTPDEKVTAFAYAVASNPVINGSSSDSDIQFTVNSLFNALAGVNGNDATTPV